MEQNIISFDILCHSLNQRFVNYQKWQSLLFEGSKTLVKTLEEQLDLPQKQFTEHTSKVNTSYVSAMPIDTDSEFSIHEFTGNTHRSDGIVHYTLKVYLDPLRSGANAYPKKVFILPIESCLVKSQCVWRLGSTRDESHDNKPEWQSDPNQMADHVICQIFNYLRFNPLEQDPTAELSSDKSRARFGFGPF